MTRPSIDFWFEFASTYSYLTAMRIDVHAAAIGVDVRWRPFLLGPIFAGQGWSTSPFNIYPAKGRYMWRDMERQCRRAGLPLARPDPFPQNGLLAARVALVGLAGEFAGDWGPAFVRRVYKAEFGEGRNIGEESVVAELLLDVYQDPEIVIERALAPQNKALLKSETEEAMARGIFGAPSFLTEDGELFWGNDRLDEALEWAAGERGAL
ncbi:MAG TPA: 2-hydroxychromene-2-carboxylate isomerase [Hyphomicrobiales bacterium]|nr:2-hydroxychromene-2-carboxylate isomerase [Hyphomicrobiales bacterium]